MSRSHLALCLALAVLAGTATFAQTDQTGVLEGFVRVGGGEPIPGAVILASVAGGGYPRDAVTDDRGRFRLGFLNPGDYVVMIQADGFQDQQVEQVRISAGATRALEVEMTAMEEFTEAMVVTAASPLIDDSTTEFGLTLDARDTELLPISRSATDLVKFTPGASNGAVWGGSTDQANSYKLDGVGVNQPGFGGDFLLPNVDWIEEFQVKGLGAGAEDGNFQGGLISIVTKSGTNELKGGVRVNFEDESLNATNLDTREAGSEDDQRFEWNADVAGPIVRDKLYYFLSAQQFERDTNIVDEAASTGDDIVFLPVQEQRTETKLFGKLTWQPRQTSFVHLVLGWDDVETENRGLSSFVAPEAAETQESPSTFYNASWSQTFGSNAFFELKLTGFDADDDRLPKNGDIPSVQILGGDRNVFTNAKYTRLQSPESNGLTAGLDYYFSTGSVDHELKVGLEVLEGSWLERRLRNGNLTWRPEEGDGPFDPQDPATWGFISSDWGGDINLDAETTNTALYVQDYIDVSSNLRLSAGLRWGTWEGDLTPGFGGGGSFQAVEDEAFDPRLGLVWDLTGDGDWLAKIHWGRYHQSLFALMFDRVIGGNVFQDEEFWDWIGPGLPDVGRNYTLTERDQFFELFDLNPIGGEVGPALDYEQPFVDQLVVGIEYRLSDAWKLGLTWVNRENDNILALVDRGLATNYTEFNNVEVIDFRSGDPILDANGVPLVLPRVLVSNDDILGRGWAPGLSDAQVGALRWNPDLVLTNPEDATREMDQFQLTFDGRGSSWDFSGSLVYTDLEGNFFSVSGYGDDPFGVGAGSFVRPNEAINRDGALQGVDEWELKLRLTADLPWALRGGVYLNYRSGEVVTPIYEIDNRNHDFIAANGEFFSFRHFSDVTGENVFLEPRGSRELDDSTILDLHLDRVFELGGGSDLILGFDLFNLVNDDAVTRINDLVNDQDPSDPSTLFGAPERRVAPRTVRLYASFRF